jgi:hypothetical protein
VVINTILIVKSGKEKTAALYAMMGKRVVRETKKNLAWRAIFFEKMSYNSRLARIVTMQSAICKNK